MVATHFAQKLGNTILDSDILFLRFSIS